MLRIPYRYASKQVILSACWITALCDAKLICQVHLSMCSPRHAPTSAIVCLRNVFRYLTHACATTVYPLTCPGLSKRQIHAKLGWPGILSNCALCPPSFRFDWHERLVCKSRGLLFCMLGLSSSRGFNLPFAFLTSISVDATCSTACTNLAFDCFFFP